MGDGLVSDAWGRSLSWSEARGLAAEVHLIADAATRAAIARDLDLPAIGRLEATLNLTPWLDGVMIDGRVDAVVTQICGVTLDPFEVVIEEPVGLRIVPVGSPNAPAPPANEVIIDLDAEDPPDEATGEALDLAAYVVEALALALDPFPRKPGAVFVSPAPVGETSPFAALARLTRPPS